MWDMEGAWFIGRSGCGIDAESANSNLEMQSRFNAEYSPKEVRPMNPWKQHLLDLLRNILRFTMWLVLVVNALLLGVFSIYFVARFLRPQP